jgi:hypothetical protein
MIPCDSVEDRKMISSVIHHLSSGDLREGKKRVGPDRS